MKLNLDKNEIALLLIRIVAGLSFLVAGIAKTYWTTWGGHTAAWTPATNLNNGGGGILHTMFLSMASATWTAPLVITGEILIGVAILLGLTTRIAAFFGAIEAGLFWANGYFALRGTPLRPDSGVLGLGWGGNSGPINDDMMLIVMFSILVIFGAGAIKYTLAGYLNKFEIVKKNKILKLLVN